MNGSSISESGDFNAVVVIIIVLVVTLIVITVIIFVIVFLRRRILSREISKNANNNTLPLSKNTINEYSNGEMVGEYEIEKPLWRSLKLFFYTVIRGLFIISYEV
jgi:ABC-type dipeptide/oligopeptide/nickel transport system permease component